MKTNFQMPLVVDPSSSVRFRVDTRCGYISYGAQDWNKALEYFQTQGLTLRFCRDINDDGVVIASSDGEDEKS